MRKILAALAAIVLAMSAYATIPAQPAHALTLGPCYGWSINSPVAHMTQHAGQFVLLTAGGGVYAPCGPFYGSAAGQPYFAGRTAHHIILCKSGNNITGYTIYDLTNSAYHYGAWCN